jgi:HEPN domain-containing protein
MKQTTKDWLTVAEDDLLAAKTLASEGRINETYIDTRYPGDLGLLPHGKPTISEIEPFIQLCDTLFNRLSNQLR